VAATLNARPRKTLAWKPRQRRLPNCLYWPCRETPGTDPELSKQERLSWLRMLPVRIPDPVAFLGEIKRIIPRSRPASGRAPSRAGLVQDAACGTGAQRRPVLDETEHGAMLVQVGPPAASSKTATPNRVLPVIPAIE